MLTFKEGLDLFHITEKAGGDRSDNVIYDEDGNDVIIEIPEGQPFGDDRKHAKWFGLTEDFTLHYDSTGDMAHLKYKTKKEIKLVVMIANSFDEKDLYATLISKIEKMEGIDGIIGKDDPINDRDTWLELCLFHPQNLLEDDLVVLNHEDRPVCRTYKHDDLGYLHSFAIRTEYIEIDCDSG